MTIIERGMRWADTGLNSAVTLPENSLCHQVDAAVMEFFFSPAFEYQNSTDGGKTFPPSNALRVGKRIIRNIFFTGYAPIQAVVYSVLHPVNAVKAVPFLLAKQGLALFSLRSLASMTASMAGAGLALSVCFGCALPIPGLLITASFALALLATALASPEARLQPMLAWVENLSTGVILGHATAWIMRRRFEGPLQKLREEAGTTLSLPEATHEFVNGDGQPLLIFEGKQLAGFRAGNAALDEAFKAKLLGHTALKGGGDWAKYEPSAAYVQGPNDVFLHGDLLGPGLASNPSQTWSMWTGSKGLPKITLQHGALATTLTTATQVRTRIERRPRSVAARAVSSVS
ncbi:MAG: hypothetical protein ACOYKZ_05720 [Chlamydiia bacterium]